MPEIHYTFLDALEANGRDSIAPFEHWRMLHVTMDSLLHTVSLPSSPTLTMRLVAEASELHDYALSVLQNDYECDVICILPDDDVVPAHVFDPAAPAGHPSKRSR